MRGVLRRVLSPRSSLVSRQSSVPKLKTDFTSSLIAGDAICAVVQLTFSRRKATVDATRKHRHLAPSVWSGSIRPGGLLGQATAASLSRSAARNLRRDDVHRGALSSSHPPPPPPLLLPSSPPPTILPPFPPRRVCSCSRRPGAPQPATRGLVELRHPCSASCVAASIDDVEAWCRSSHWPNGSDDVVYRAGKPCGCSR